MRQRAFWRRVGTGCLGMLVAVLCSCEDQSKSKDRVLVVGSTSVEPFAEKLALEFQRLNPGIRVDVQGGGSTAGIHIVSEGAASIGASSRRLTPEEMQGLDEFLIARDGIAVIVHKDNPVSGLTVAQVRKIFTREVQDWAQLGGRPGPIYPVTREEGSGTRGAFQEMVVKEWEISAECLVANSNGAVREIVSQSREFIGYISLGLVDQRVTALKIAKVPATRANIENGSYPFVRPFLFLTKSDPQEAAKKFIEFVLSAAGQKVLEKDGLVGPDRRKERAAR